MRTVGGLKGKTMRDLWLLAVALVLVILPAHADMVARNNVGETVRLFDTPCENGKILKAVEDQLNEARIPIPKMQSGEATLEDGKHQVCWVLTESLNVVVVYENGMAAAIPILHFAEERAQGI